MSQLRFAVVKDVLFQIEQGRLQVQEGSYYVFGGKQFSSLVGVDGFELPTRECRVCALGALLVSYLRKDHTKFDVLEKADRETRERFNGALLIDSILGNIFEPKQLQMIEVTFETWGLSGHRASLLSKEEIADCRIFGSRYHNGQERLVAICNNILENNGIFIPSKKESV